MPPVNKAAAMLEVALRLGQPGQYDRQQKMLLEGEYRTLSLDEAHELGRLAVSLLDSDAVKARGIAEDILVSLICFVPGALSGLHQSLVAREVFYPGEIYLGADAESRDALVRRVMWDEANLDHLLVALAWIGDAAV